MGALTSLGKAWGRVIGRAAGDEQLGETTGGSLAQLGGAFFGTAPAPAPAAPSTPEPQGLSDTAKVGVGVALGVTLTVIASKLMER